MHAFICYKKAFTLIELLVALVMLCIILTLALPALSGIMMNNRMRTSTDLWVNALNYARNTALSQSTTTYVCPFSSAGSVNCGTNWSTGWIVVGQSSTGTNVLLQSQQIASSDPTLKGTVTKVTFDSHGLTTTAGNFTLCDKRGSSSASSVQVLITGYVQSGATAGSAVWDSSALSCP